MRYYTVTQLARKWGISRQGVHQWLVRARIKPVTLGESRESGVPYLGLYKATQVESKRLKMKLK